MKTVRIILFLLSILTMVAGAAVSLQINGAAYDTISLKTSQAVTVEIASDDASAYSVYAGFATAGTALGTFASPAVLPAAGNLASVMAVVPPPVWGYYASAGGASPAPSAGVHFQFTYTPSTVGTTTLYLYASDATTLLDSIAITVEPAALGSAFTYQGRLIDDNQAPNGTYDFEFKLYDAPTEGSQLGSTHLDEDADVLDGYFTTELDFGLSPYNGNSVWLQVGVRPGASTDPYTILSPRQRLTSTPNASFASRSDWNNLLNMPAGFSDGVDNILSESQVENYIANDVDSWYLAYNNGTKLVGSDIFQRPSGAIGIGGASDSVRLYVNNTDMMYSTYSRNDSTASTRYGVAGFCFGDNPNFSYGVLGSSSSTTGSNYGLYGSASTASTGNNYGVYGYSYNSGSGNAYAGYFQGDVHITGYLNRSSGLHIATDDGAEVGIGASPISTQKLYVYTDSDMMAVHGNAANPSNTNYGLYGQATTNSTGTNYGVYGYGSNGGTGGAYAGYFNGDLYTTGNFTSGGNTYLAPNDSDYVGIGSSGSSTVKLRIYNDSMTDSLNVSNNRTSGSRYGVYVGNTGNTTGSSYGVYSTSSSATGSNYGIYGNASTASTGTNYGVYGYAVNSGSGSAYAGYFYGNVYVTGNVSALSFTDRTPYPQDLQTAVDAVMSMSPLPAGQYQADKKEQQLDHSTLSPFIRSEEGKRDLSATVSCHNEVLKDLLAKQQELTEARAMINQLQQQVKSLQEDNQKLHLLEQKMNIHLSTQQ
jgi:hypothetical protein